MENLKNHLKNVQKKKKKGVTDVGNQGQQPWLATSVTEVANYSHQPW